MKFDCATDYYPHEDMYGQPCGIRECDGMLIAAMGIGYPGGWSGMNYFIAQRAVETALHDLCTANDTSDIAFQNTFTRVRQMLRNEFPYNHDTTDDILFEDNAYTTLLTLAVRHMQVSMAWLGTHESYHIRNHQIIARAAGQNRFMFASDESTDPEILQTRWQLQVGDVLIVTTRYVQEARLPEYLTGKSAAEACEAIMRSSPENYAGEILIVIRAVED